MSYDVSEFATPMFNAEITDHNLQSTNVLRSCASNVNDEDGNKSKLRAWLIHAVVHTFSKVYQETFKNASSLLFDYELVNKFLEFIGPPTAIYCLFYFYLPEIFNLLSDKLNKISLERYFQLLIHQQTEEISSLKPVQVSEFTTDNNNNNNNKNTNTYTLFSLKEDDDRNASELGRIFEFYFKEIESISHNTNCTSGNYNRELLLSSIDTESRIAPSTASALHHELKRIQQNLIQQQISDDDHDHDDDHDNLKQPGKLFIDSEQIEICQNWINQFKKFNSKPIIIDHHKGVLDNLVRTSAVVVKSTRSPHPTRKPVPILNRSTMDQLVNHRNSNLIDLISNNIGSNQGSSESNANLSIQSTMIPNEPSLSEPSSTITENNNSSNVIKNVSDELLATLAHSMTNRKGDEKLDQFYLTPDQQSKSLIGNKEVKLADQVTSSGEKLDGERFERNKLYATFNKRPTPCLSNQLPNIGSISQPNNPIKRIGVKTPRLNASVDATFNQVSLPSLRSEFEKRKHSMNAIYNTPPSSELPAGITTWGASHTGTNRSQTYKKRGSIDSTVNLFIASEKSNKNCTDSCNGLSTIDSTTASNTDIANNNHNNDSNSISGNIDDDDSNIMNISNNTSDNGADEANVKNGTTVNKAALRLSLEQCKRKIAMNEQRKLLASSKATIDRNNAVFRKLLRDKQSHKVTNAPDSTEEANSSNAMDRSNDDLIDASLTTAAVPTTVNNSNNSELNANPSIDVQNNSKTKKSDDVSTSLLSSRETSPISVDIQQPPNMSDDNHTTSNTTRITTINPDNLTQNSCLSNTSHEAERISSDISEDEDDDDDWDQQSNDCPNSFGEQGTYSVPYHSKPASSDRIRGTSPLSCASLSHVPHEWKHSRGNNTNPLSHSLTVSEASHKNAKNLNKCCHQHSASKQGHHHHPHHHNLHHHHHHQNRDDVYRGDSNSVCAQCDGKTGRFDFESEDDLEDYDDDHRSNPDFTGRHSQSSGHTYHHHQQHPHHQPDREMWRHKSNAFHVTSLHNDSNKNTNYSHRSARHRNMYNASNNSITSLNTLVDTTTNNNSISSMSNNSEILMQNHASLIDSSKIDELNRNMSDLKTNFERLSMQQQVLMASSSATAAAALMATNNNYHQRPQQGAQANAMPMHPVMIFNPSASNNNIPGNNSIHTTNSQPNLFSESFNAPSNTTSSTRATWNDRPIVKDISDVHLLNNNNHERESNLINNNSNPIQNAASPVDVKSSNDSNGLNANSTQADQATTNTVKSRNPKPKNQVYFIGFDEPDPEFTKRAKDRLAARRAEERLLASENSNRIRSEERRLRELTEHQLQERKLLEKQKREQLLKAYLDRKELADSNTNPISSAGRTNPYPVRSRSSALSRSEVNLSAQMKRKNSAKLNPILSGNHPDSSIKRDRNLSVASSLDTFPMNQNTDGSTPTIHSPRHRSRKLPVCRSSGDGQASTNLQADCDTVSCKDVGGVNLSDSKHNVKFNELSGNQQNYSQLSLSSLHRLGRNETSSSGPGVAVPRLTSANATNASSHGNTTRTSVSHQQQPRLYVKPKAKSNRSVIVNAIQYCCLAGTVNEPVKQLALKELAVTEGTHFMILFRDARCQYRGVYYFDLEAEELKFICGAGPRKITHEMCTRFFKYNCGSKQFTQITSTTHLSAVVDAVTVHDALWSSKSGSFSSGSSNYNNRS